MISVEVSQEPDSDWNKQLLYSKYGTVFQTVEYAGYIESRIKSTPNYMKFVTSSGDIAGQLLIFQSFKGSRKLKKYTGNGFLYSFSSRFSSILPKYSYWNFGPVISNSDLAGKIFDTLGNVLTSWKGRFVGSVHPLNPDFNFEKKFNFKRQNSGTFLIDLSQNLNEILDATDKKSVKKNIERSEERGVRITDISSKEDLAIYHELLNAHRQHNKLDSYTMDDVIEGHQMLSSVGQKGFLAWLDNIPIGGIFFSSFNKYINEWGIARSQIDAEKKLYSTDLLRWKIIEWGKKNNCSYYDLSGIKIENRDSKEEGIFRNKEKWGGKLVIYPSFSN